MKAAVYESNNKPQPETKLEITNIDKPELKDHGALIKVHGCGLCGSDIVKLKEDLVSSGTVLGHEVVGEVQQIESDKNHLKAGDRVVVGHHVPCYQCAYCKNGNHSMCQKFKETNIIPGGFSEYIYVSEDHLNNTVFKVPDNLSDLQASFTEPVACCLRAIKRAHITLGDNVLIIGLGSIGLIMGQIAKYYGARVAGCDLLEERLNLAKDLGFDKVIKYENLEDTPVLYKQMTNYIGADKVFLVSGSLTSVPLSMACIRDGGSIIVFSSIPSAITVFSNNDIYYRELVIMGSYSSSPCDLNESLNLIKDNIIKVDSLVKEYNLDNINRAINDTTSNKIIKAYIKL